MIISTLQENLARALTTVIKAAPTRDTLPVLMNILLVAEDSRLMVAATNLQMSVTVWIGAKVERPGSITLPARTFTELVNKLSKERVDLVLDSSTHTVQVKCGTTTANIKGIGADEFPPINHNDESGITIGAALFKDMVTETAFSVAVNDGRPILTGINVQIKHERITMAAADGYRLAVRHGVLESPSLVDMDITVPAPAMTEVARQISEGDDPISISLPGKRDIVTFHLPNVDVSSQILEGRYPDFMAIVPRSHSTSAVIDAAELLRKCETAMIFAKDQANAGRFQIVPRADEAADGKVVISGSSAERGISDNTVHAQVDGDSLDTSFNVRYLIDLLRVLKGEKVVLTSNGKEYPGVVRPESREDFLHVIMPMGK